MISITIKHNIYINIILYSNITIMNLLNSKPIDLPISNYTRSKTNQFIKNYSFDESSKEWNKNKIKCSNCTYKYKTNYQEKWIEYS